METIFVRIWCARRQVIKWYVFKWKYLCDLNEMRFGQMHVECERGRGKQLFGASAKQIACLLILTCCLICSQTYAFTLSLTWLLKRRRTVGCVCSVISTQHNWSLLYDSLGFFLFQTFDECVEKKQPDCDPKNMWLQIPFFCGHAAECWYAQSYHNTTALSLSRYDFIEFELFSCLMYLQESWQPMGTWSGQAKLSK